MIGASLLLAGSAVAGPAPGKEAEKADKAATAKRNGAISTRFLQNKGQWDARAKFLAQAPNLNLWVTDSGYVLDYRQKPHDRKATEARGHVVEMKFVNAAKAKVSGYSALKARTDFYRDGKMVRNAGSFLEVKQKDLYEGVTVRNYFSKGFPRYDIEVAPHADANQVRFAFKGATSIKANGTSLDIGTSVGDIKQGGLYAYQMVNGKQQRVAAAFTKGTDGTVGFKLGKYDHSKKLVIDPLVYGSYFGGNFGFDRVSAVVSEPDGGVFMTGWTQTTSFPVISGPYGFNLLGSRDAFITRFQGDAYNIDYNAYIGGSGRDQGDFIALDPQRKSVWICGSTTSNNFPGIDGTSHRQAAGPNFLIQFTKDQAQILTPTYSTYFGQASGAEIVSGFTIAPNGDLLLAGLVAGTMETTGTDPNLINPRGGIDVYLQRFDSTGKTLKSGRYFGGNEDDDCTGLAVDSGSNAVISGTIFLPSGGQVDTSVNTAVFETTDGVYPNGRLIRSSDAYVARFAPDGSTLYSAVIGGSDQDFGSGVAVDTEDNAYILGVSGSFDFPRTRGVLGEQNLLGTLTVTKIRPSVGVSTDQQIVYSTGLNTSNTVIPVGIAVDAQGNASITGMVDGGEIFPEDTGATPPNPNRPSSFTGQGSIQVTPDNIKASYTFEPVPFYLTSDAWLNTINSTATRLLYGTYIGSTLDDDVSPPYVDPVGDVWVFGETFMQTAFVVTPWPSTGTPPDPLRVMQYNALPASHITPLAFKPTPDVPIGIANAAQTDQSIGFVPYNRLPGNPNSGVFPTGRADGYILRFRNLIPTVNSVVLNPNVAAGGLGVTVNGTVTLGSAAPAAGADVTLTIDNPSAAVFANGTSSTVINIPAGQTAGGFTVSTLEVTKQEAVKVTATYEGAFKVGSLEVVPWLQSVSVTPSTLVGGNSTTGRVNLAQAAPAGGVAVDVSTNNTGLVTFASPTVTVPAGQTTATFTITTHGVSTQTNAFVTASLLGVNRSQQITLNTANLRSLSFNPATLAGGGVTKGTILLDGEAGSAFNVTLTGLPNSYLYTPASPITVPAGANSVTFDVATPIETTRVTRTVTATRPASGGYASGTTSGSFTVEVATVNKLTLKPSTVESGGDSIATIELAAPAPAGGATVQITYNKNTVSVSDLVDPEHDGSGKVVVPAGAVSQDFTLTASLVAQTAVTKITAYRLASDAKSANLTINAGSFRISLNPSSVLGGEIATGTVELTTPAGPTGFKVYLDAGYGITFDTPTVTVPAGATTATFRINTPVVRSNINATIKGTSGTIRATTTLLIRANGVASLRVSPSSVKGGNAISVTITLDAPAGAGGEIISLAASNAGLLSGFPAARTVPEGSFSITFTALTRRVSRSQTLIISASNAGSSAVAPLTINR